MAGPVHYRITSKSPEAHIFEVSCTVAAPAPDGQAFSLPTWIPGSYVIRDYAKHVVRVWADAGGKPVEVVQQDKATWACAPCAGPLTLTYEVYAGELSVHAAHLDTTHGYFNGTSVFVWPHGRADQPCVVDIQPPAGTAYAQWRVVTAMARDQAMPYGFGTYRAGNYEELVDHPVEMGTFDLVSFEVYGVPHELAISGRHDADLERLRQDLTVVCAQHVELFGQPSPVERYVFLLRVLSEGYGGLEHRASSSLMCSRDDLPRAGGEMTDGYRNFLGLCSHEYFHTWHIKRIKPVAFLPFDLSAETYTRSLWVFEGFTTYYQHLALVRAGLISEDDFLEFAGRMMTRVRRGAGRHKQSVAQSSFEAWTKFYKADENAPNAVVNYYVKGALVALALDLLIRRDRVGRFSLDDVMRALWERFGQTGRGVPEAGVERLSEEITGLDLQGFFDNAVYGTADLPLEPLLEHFGIGVSQRPASGPDDPGGKPASMPADQLAKRAVLGVRLEEQGEMPRLAMVFDGGAAQAAGLAPGDLLVAWQGVRLSRDNLAKHLARHRPGDRVQLHIFRRDELMTVELVLLAPPADTYVLTRLDDVDQATCHRRSAWLRAD